jgi:outer membrane protein
MTTLGSRISQTLILLASLSAVHAAWGDGVGADPITLTLDKSIDIAVHNSTQVLQQQNQKELNGAEVLQSYGQFLPNLSINATYGYGSGKQLYTIQGVTIVDARARNATLGVSSTLNLFNGLADYSGLQASLARKRSTELSLDWARRQIALDITQSYLQVTLDQSLLDISRKNLEASQARLRLLQGQSEVGSASVPDLYRQQAQTSADSFTVTSYEAKLNEDSTFLLRKLRVDMDRKYRFDSPDLKPAHLPLAEKPVEQL